MILHIYAYKDERIGAFKSPAYAPDEKEVVIEQTARYAVLAKDEEKANLVFCSLYYLGDFDDKTGEIKPVAPEFLMSFTKEMLYGARDSREEAKEA